MKITSLLENTTKSNDMLIEHGLSLYIETKEYKILFDMGQSDAFVKNAKTLGIDISKVDFAVLSHGHYDHGGGLATFLERNSKAKVYIHKDAFLPHYNGTGKYIGLDTLQEHNPRLIFTSNEHHIHQGISLYSCNSKIKKYNFGSFGLTEKIENQFVPDDFRHEQYLLIKEDNKSILFSGCSHKGVLDIVDWFEPDVLVGGFHFSKMELGRELKGAALRLEKNNTKYYTCHCTGIDQFSYMKDYMSRLHYLSCGDTIIL